MLLSIATDAYLTNHLIAITHADFAATPANLSLVPWYRIRGELSHGRGNIKAGGERKERRAKK